MRSGNNSGGVVMPNMQRELCGHVIVYPQKPEIVAKKLPPGIEDIVTPMCVLFIGSKPLTWEWLNKNAKLLTTHAD